MDFYKARHRYYCGVDLHSRTMYLCVVGQEGVVLLHRSLPCDPVRFLLAVAPYREDLVVAVECVYSWYWLADLCASEGIAFVLGHALYMKAIHGAKAKSDRIDSEKVAVLLRGGLMRATRDLMRRRLLFVRQARISPRPRPDRSRSAELGADERSGPSTLIPLCDGSGAPARRT